jgi:hypothetical protein
MRVPLSLPLQDIIHDFCEITGLAENQCSAAQIDMIAAVRHALDRRTRNNRTDDEEIYHLQIEKISLQNALNELHEGRYNLDVHDLELTTPLLPRELGVRIQNLRSSIKKLKQIMANKKNDGLKVGKSDDFDQKDGNERNRNTPGIRYYSGDVPVRSTRLRNRNDILDIIYTPSKDEVSGDYCLPFGNSRASVF